MGYYTDFEGVFAITPSLDKDQIAYLQKFVDTRRITWDVSEIKDAPDPLREAVGLPVGKDGEFFVGADGAYGQEHGPRVADSNRPPAEQPGLWCQWLATEGGNFLGWDQGEKFYRYIEWLDYMVENFFKPWGVTLDGTVEWNGEEFGDQGKIEVKDNRVQAFMLDTSWQDKPFFG